MLYEVITDSAPPAEGSGAPTAADLAEWKARQPLVGIPFLLDSSGTIRLPADNPGDEEIRRFYWRYLRVFGSEETIPVYRNIAAEYESSIVTARAEGLAYGASPSAADKLSAAEELSEESGAPAVSGSLAASGAPAPAQAPAAAPTSERSSYNFV